MQRALLSKPWTPSGAGELVAYTTCTLHRPHLVVEDVLGERSDVEVLDAAQYLPVLDGGSPTVHLWPRASAKSLVMW